MREWEIPEGYRGITILLSQKEYLQLRKEANLEQRGTISEVARKKMGFKTSFPYGFKKAKKALDEAVGEVIS